jgi:hypothetical protein
MPDPSVVKTTTSLSRKPVNWASHLNLAAIMFLRLLVVWYSILSIGFQISNLVIWTTINKRIIFKWAESYFSKYCDKEKCLSLSCQNLNISKSWIVHHLEQQTFSLWFFGSERHQWYSFAKLQFRLTPDFELL